MDIIHERALATILFCCVFVILIVATAPYIKDQITQADEINDQSLKYSKPVLDGTNTNFDIDNIPRDDVVTIFARGDVNMDGEVSKLDIELVNKYIAGTVTLNQEQMYLADLNSDGKIDNSDVERIKKMCETAPTLNYDKGDVNRDGNIDISDLSLLKKYINGKVTFVSEQKKLADVNGDGKINDEDVKALNTMIGGINYDMGDVDRDKQVTIYDAQLVLNFINGTATLDDEQLELADMDKDGEVTSKDAQKIMVIARG